MLGLEVAAPGDLIFKVVVVLFKELYGIRIGNADKIGICHVLQTLFETLIDKLVEEVDVLWAARHNVFDDVLDHGLHEIHVVVEISKRDLRLDHPELCRMTLRVGALCAERGTERIDLTERHGHALRPKLAGNGEGRLLAEEILAVIDRTVLVFRDIVEVERCQLEHLARALAVTARDNRRMHVGEAVLVEELMDGERRSGTHAERRVEEVRSRAQVRNRTQVFHRVALLLKRVFRRGRALNGNLLRLNFKRLLRFRREQQRTGDTQRSADILGSDLLVIFEFFRRKDNLYALKAAAVIQIDKSERFGVADRSRPATDRDLRIAKGLRRSVEGRDFCSFHDDHIPFRAALKLHTQNLRFGMRHFSANNHFYYHTTNAIGLARKILNFLPENAIYARSFFKIA